MRRVGRSRLLLILLVLVISLASLIPQEFDIRFLGVRLQRGSDAILGMRLGLDLQGGSQLIYQARGTKEIRVTFGEPVEEDVIRTVLTDLGRPDAIIQTSGTEAVTIAVDFLKAEELDVVGNVTLAEEEVIRQAFMEQVGVVITFEVADIAREVTVEQMEGVLDIISRRVNPLGFAEPVIQLMPDVNRILVELPGVGNVEEIKRLIGETASLEFIERTCLSTQPITLPGGQVINACDLPENHVDKETGLTGEDLIRAFPGTHPQTGLPIVSLNFNSRGTKIFAEMTTRLAGTPDRFVIFLDENEIVAPVVVQPILSGNPFIEGPTFTSDRVRTIAIQLESGRLPIPLEVVRERNVNATLGAESLRKSLIAGVIGLGLVLIFMALYYRAAGVVAAIALLIYTASVLAIFKLVPITLTLAGIAAFILSIGMAVDANILIFERMKEELRLGRTLGSAIEIGFNRAWTSIRDSNVSTLITCAILFWFGQRLGASLVSGFATTLAIGVILSMFSAIVVTKTLLILFSVSPLGRQRAFFTPESLPAPSQPGAASVAKERE